MPKETINGLLRDQHPEEFAQTPYLVVGWSKEPGVVDIGCVAGGDYESPLQCPTMSITVGRHDINRLIRALRRARDYAFGADA